MVNIVRATYVFIATPLADGITAWSTRGRSKAGRPGAWLRVVKGSKAKKTPQQRGSNRDLSRKRAVRSEAVSGLDGYGARSLGYAEVAVGVRRGHVVFPHLGVFIRQVLTDNRH